MYNGLRVSAIAAVADNGVIGVEGGLPWHLPADLRWFERVTRGHAVIMGRKTWQSLPNPLARRLNIVLTRDADALRADMERYGEAAMAGGSRLLVVTSLERALAAAAEWEQGALAAARVAAPEIMVVGGGAVYAALWPWVDRFYRTRVALNPAGDAHFPKVDLSAFALTSSTEGEGEPAHVFEVLAR